MLEWLKRLLGIKKVKVIINNNDIEIETHDLDDITIHDIIEDFDTRISLTSYTDIDRSRYYPDNIYLTYKDVKVCGDDYIWELNAKYFNKKFLEYVWERAFKYTARWSSNDAIVEIIATVVYPDGVRSKVYMKGEKFYNNGVVYKCKCHWE